MNVNKEVEKFVNSVIFKPLLLRVVENNINDIIVIFAAQYSSTVSIDATKKRIITDSTNITVLNVSKSLASDMPFFETFGLQDLEKFKNSISILDDNPEDYFEEISYTMEILTGAAMNLSKQLDDISKAISATSTIIQDAQGESDSGQVLMTDNYSNLVHLSLKSVDGKELQLDEQSMEKIGGVLAEITQNHSHDSLNSKAETKRLKDEIEYRIIESLPPSIKADQIKINIGPIVEKIKSLRDTDDESE